jgi:hypothetical protein
MKRILCVAMLLAAGPAMAGEITVKVSDADQQAFSNLPQAVDACVSGLTLRSDAQMCRLISQFVTEFGGKVKAAAPPAAEPAK